LTTWWLCRAFRPEAGYSRWAAVPARPRRRSPRRGYRILCIELGENLAAVARRKLDAYPRVEARTGAFEEWPAEENAFDHAVSAEAFHWLDQEIAYRKDRSGAEAGRSYGPVLEQARTERQERGVLEAAQEIYERETPGIVKPEDYKGLPVPTRSRAGWRASVKRGSSTR
jgi:hypothetical protein